MGQASFHCQKKHSVLYYFVNDSAYGSYSVVAFSKVGAKHRRLDWTIKNHYFEKILVITRPRSIEFYNTNMFKPDCGSVFPNGNQ